jgi:hypothetical protein
VAIAASLVVRISTEFGSFVRGIRQAEKDLNGFGKRAERVGRDLSTSLTLPIVGLGAVLFKAASDLERTENMFNASFGGMATAARDWSEQTAQALGLDADEIRNSMSRFNQLAQSMELPAASALMMSKGLTQLTLDLQAYRNISAEAASSTLEGALAGRMRGLVQLGIVVKEADVQQTAMRLGMIRTGQTMSEQQAMVARYVTVTEKLKAVNGEFARSGDKPAVMLVKLRQQLGDVAETMGTALMPGMQKVVGRALDMARSLKGMADSFALLTPTVRVGVVAIAGIAAAIGPGLLAIGYLTRLLPKFAVAWRLAFTPIGGTIALAVAALWGLAAAWRLVAYEQGRSVERGQTAMSGILRQQQAAEREARRIRPPGSILERRTPAQAMADETRAMVAEANRLAEAERRLAEVRAKFAPGRGAKLTKNIAEGLAARGFGDFKSIADDVKRAVDAISKLPEAVKNINGLKEAIAATKSETYYWAERMAEQADAVRQKFENMAAGIEGSLTNLFSDVLMGQADAFKRFLDTITRMLADFAAQELVRSFFPMIGQGILRLALPSAPNLGTGLMGNPLPVPSRVGARAGGDTFHVVTNFSPSFIDGRSGAAWLRENEGVITEAVINGVRKSGAARQALVGR